MKRFVLILFIIIFSYGISYAKIEFDINLLGNFSYCGNGDYNEFAETLSMFSTLSSSNGPMMDDGGGDDYSQNGSIGTELEFRIKIQKDLAFGIEFGMMSLPLGSIPFISEDGGSNSGYSTMEISGSAISIALIEYYILDISKTIDMSFGVGVEYCSGSFDASVPDQSWSWIGQGDGIGFKAKILFEFKISEIFKIITGAKFRYLEITGLKNEETGEIMYSYYEDNQNMGGNDDGGYRMWQPASSKEDINGHDVEEASIGLSGVSLQLGIGFTF